MSKRMFSLGSWPGSVISKSCEKAWILSLGFSPHNPNLQAFILPLRLHVTRPDILKPASMIYRSAHRTGFNSANDAFQVCYLRPPIYQQGRCSATSKFCVRNEQLHDPFLGSVEVGFVGVLAGLCKGAEASEISVTASVFLWEREFLDLGRNGYNVLVSVSKQALVAKLRTWDERGPYWYK